MRNATTTTLRSPFARPTSVARLLVALPPFALVLMVGAECLAKDVYIAQTTAGAGNGSSCGNSFAATFFNDAANWGSGPAQVGPGATVHLCGTLSSPLTVQGSGTAGSPITILWEPDAKISLPYCDGNGCLNANGRSYVVFDGGSNGVIENTQNGSALANQVSGVGITASPCDHCEFKNLSFNDMYVHSSASDSTFPGGGCVNAYGAGVQIHDNKAHDNGWCFSLGPATSASATGDIYNNVVSRSNHCFTFGAGNAHITGGSIHDNECYDEFNWDDNANANHHDGIHVYGVSGGTVSDIQIYNNYFHGSWGSHTTAHVYIEGNVANYYVFNNLLVGYPGEDHALLFLNQHSSANSAGTPGGNGYVYNNTLIGPNTSNTNDGVATILDSDNVTLRNNILTNCWTLLWIWSAASLNSDNNMFSTNGTMHLADYMTAGTTFDTLAAWQSGSAQDAHSQQVSNLGLNASYQPNAGSPVIGAGTNLTSLGIAALQSDKSGVPRPSSGPWDVGAYEYCVGSGCTPLDGGAGDGGSTSGNDGGSSGSSGGSSGGGSSSGSGGGSSSGGSSGGAGSGSGGAASGSGGGAGNGAAPGSSSGCGCRLARDEGQPIGAALSIALAAMTAARWRRRTR